MTLRVFVAGASGVLGKRIVEMLADRGHVVVGLTRDREGDELVAERGGVPRRGDVLDRASLEWSAGDCDVVVHAASAVPTGRKPSAEEWERNDRVRRQGAANLTNAAATGRAERYVQASVAWLVRTDDGSPVDEASPPNPDRTTRSALEAEQRARAAERFGLEPFVLRLGWLYAADSVQTHRLARQLLDGRAPVPCPGLLGRGDAELSLVHADDAARALADAAEEGAPEDGRGDAGRARAVPATGGQQPPGAPGGGPTGGGGRPGGNPATGSTTGGGSSRASPPAGPAARAQLGMNPRRSPPRNTYHVVDDEPVALTAFLKALAERLGASPPRRVPGWLARPFVGGDLVRFLTTGFPTSAERFREGFDWSPTYETYRKGLDEVVDTWRADGLLVESDDGLAWADAD